MVGVCMAQTSYRQHDAEQQYQMFNNKMLLLQKAPQLQSINSNAYHIKKQQSIAPAPNILVSSNLHNIQVGPAGGGGGTLLPRKKYTYLNMPHGEQPLSVARRNARERNRVKQVNNGFTKLRQQLPQTIINALSHGGRGANKKLSKVDTLRIAVEYIRGLEDMLGESQPAESKMQVNTSVDESSTDGSNYGYSSMGSPRELAFNNQLQQSYHSEVSASPAPSYSGDSDISTAGTTGYLHSVKLEQQRPAKEDTYVMPLKYETFDDNFEHMSTDDETLLDYISSWQSTVS